MSTPVYAILVVALLVGVSMGTEKISFNATMDNLPWPLIDPNDYGSLIGHGIHCKELIEGFQGKPPADPVQHIHADHCRHNLRRLLRFFETQPNYSVPRQICEDLIEVVLCDECRRALPVTGQFEILDHTKSGLTHSAFVFREMRKRAHSPAQLFGLLRAQNYGDILIKQKLEPEAITAAESDYADRVFTRPVDIRIAAQGLYCELSFKHGLSTSVLHYLQQLLAV